MAKDVKLDEETEGEAPVEKKGSTMKLIIIINAVVVLVLVAVVVAVFMLKGGEEKQDTEVLADEVPVVEEAAQDEAAATVQTPIYIPMSPPFVVNLENQEQISFLQVEMEAMTYDPKVQEAMKVHASRIRSELLLLLGSKQYSEISNIEGKRKLSQDAIAVIQNILNETGTTGTVEALYFTSFVMQ